MVSFALWALALVSAASFALGDHVVPALQQSFFFDWNPVGQLVPVPTTAQCNVIQISWSRSTATGPNNVAPYYLQIYTSTFLFPIIIPAGSGLQYNFTVPFVPDTQYEICMFDVNGNTGGCQAVYTVYPAANTTADNPPTCTNVTYPATTLQVDGTVHNGPISRYGWVDQCTDLTLTPKNGTPPFTMTIAPALHPPFNITSHTMDPITWTVSLSHAMPFFVSLVDSTGLSWSNGPMHSGAGGPTACLDLSPHSNKVATPVAIGSAFGSLILGGTLGVLVMGLFVRHKYGRLRRDSVSSSLDGSPTAGPGTRYGIGTMTNPPARNSNHPNRIGQYEIEPFALAGESQSRSPLTPQAHTSRTSDSQSDPSTGAQQRSHVYVLHHDGGRAPVTVYADGDAHIVELPPTYARQDEPPPAQPQRRPGPAPRKMSNT